MSAGQFHPAYLTVRTDGDVSIVGFTVSNLTDDENIEQLGRELFNLVDQTGCRKLVLDMDGVRYATSSVLGKLISLHRKVHRVDGRLIICNIGKGLEEIMSTSRLNRYFNMADDVASAGELMSGS